jgi:tetratricopeptide (TPR) repeat protein
LYRVLELNGEYEAALRGWKDYLSRYPDNQVAPRFIMRNEAHLVREAAKTAFAEAQAARDAGQLTEANTLQQKGEALWAEAREKWSALAAEDATYGNAQLQLMNAEELRKKGMYYDAIALLDSARFESGEMFMELSDVIIELKQEGGIPLSLSERMEMERRAEAARYREQEQAMREQAQN